MVPIYWFYLKIFEDQDQNHYQDLKNRRQGTGLEPGLGSRHGPKSGLEQNEEENLDLDNNIVLITSCRWTRTVAGRDTFRDLYGAHADQSMTTSLRFEGEIAPSCCQDVQVSLLLSPPLLQLTAF